MPRVSRRSKRRKSGYTAEDVRYLLKGVSYFNDGIAADIELAREAWPIFRRELIDNECEPFSRPWGFWAFDAPDRRERTDGGVHPHDDPARNAYIEDNERQYPGFKQQVSKLFWGCPGAYLPKFDSRDESYETDRQYLLRHPELLTDREREILEAER